MQILPSLQFGLQNGWVLWIAYFIGLILSVLAYPTDKRKKLFSEPTYPRGDPRRAILAVGSIAAVMFITSTLFVPLILGGPLLYVGLSAYVLGYLAVMISLHEYRHAPVDSIVETGLYRFSRNPQWLGLVMVFLGTALAMGSGLHLFLLAVVVISYHFRILCEEQVCEAAYGESYTRYKRRVPRYLIV